MAQWRPNPTLYGEGGGEFVDDAGQVWPDPWGTLQANQQQPNPAVAPRAPELSGGGAPLPAPPPGLAEFVAPQAPYVDPAAPKGTHGMVPTAEEARTADLTAQVAAPVPTPGFANKPAGAPPTPTPGFADAGATQTTTSTTTEKGSTGLSDEAQKRQGANITQVAGAKNAEVNASVAHGNLAANQAAERSRTLLADAAAGVEKTAAQIAINDHIQNEVNRKMQEGAEWRPDRAELFSGDRGVAFGLMSAVAAMAGAWMQGRGLTGANPYLPTIMKMIDDNVQDQVRRNSSSVQFLKEKKGDLKAAMLELKQRQLAYAQQRLDGLALRDSSELLRAGVEKTRTEMQAKNAEWEQEKRQALERTETKKTTSTLTRAPKPANVAGQQAAGALRQLDRIIGDLQMAEKSGALSSVTGWQDKIGANGFQEFFGGLPPEQQRAVNALRELELINRADWKSEPNGQAVQERLSQIGIAKNDRDIPVMMQRLNSLREDKALGIKQAPISGPDPTTGAF